MDHHMEFKGEQQLSSQDLLPECVGELPLTDDVNEQSLPESILSNTLVNAEPKLSKNKMKKMIKMQRWKDQKAEKCQLHKERRKEKRRQQRERGDIGVSKKELKRNTMSGSSCKIQVVLDCSFDDLMVDRDITKLGQQLQYCYSSNRRASQPLQFYLTSLGGKTLQRLERIGDYRGWDIHLRSHSYLDEFAKDSIVYLTSDSPNVLQSLEPNKAYIIGGLVDHNHHKGLCFELAQKYGVGHAQLPIGEYVQLSSRKVLTVNHVFEILLRFTELQSWKEAFYRVIPRRKQAGQSRLERRQLKKREELTNDCASSAAVEVTATLAEGTLNGEVTTCYVSNTAGDKGISEGLVTTDAMRVGGMDP